MTRCAGALVAAALFAIVGARAADPTAPPAVGAADEPAGPAASPAVQALLDDAERLLAERDAEASLVVTDRALAGSRGVDDRPGEAFALRARALALDALDRVDEALTAWREVERIWEEQGALPERIGSIDGELRTAIRTRNSEALNDAVERAASLASAGTDRPTALIEALNASIERLWRVGQLIPADRLARAALPIAEERVPDSLALAACLNHLGTVAAQRGDQPAAREHFARSLEIRERLAPGSLAVATTLNGLGHVARSEGDLEAARGYYVRSLAIREELAPGSLSVAGSLNSLGNVDVDLGDLVAGREHHGRALEIQERHAPGSLALTTSLNGLGNVAYGLGDLGTAREFYERALEIHEKHDPGTINVASVLNNLGSVTVAQGDLDAGEEYHRRALEIRERHAPGSLEVAYSLSNLGTVARTRGDLAAAREFQLRALEIRERQAPGSLQVAQSLSHLADVERLEGDLDHALEHNRRALEIRERHAPGTIDLALSLDNIGVVARDRGDLESAREYHRRALEIKERNAPGSIEVAATLNNLAAVAAFQGNLEAAREHFSRAVEIQEEHQPGSPALATTLDNLSIILADQGDLEGARDYNRRALEIRERLVPDSLDLALSLGSLGNLVCAQGDLEAARELFRRSLEIREKHAPGSLALATILNNLGVVAKRQGDSEAARGHYARALAIQEKMAPGSLDVAASLTNLGVLARQEGDLDAARELYRRGLEISERHAPGSLDVAVCLNNLGVVADAQGDHESAREFLARAWSIVREQGRAVPGDDARLAFSEAHASYSYRLIAEDIRLGHPERALSVLEESRAQGLLELFGRRGLARSATAESWSAFRRAERQRDRAGEALAEGTTRVTLLERDLADLEAQGMSGDELAPKQAELAEGRRVRETALGAYTLARMEMTARLAEVKRSVPGLEPEPISTGAARGALPPAAVFLAFSVGDESTAVLLVPADPERAPLGYVVDLGEEQLARRVAFIRERLGVGRVDRGMVIAEATRLESASRALAEKLFTAEARALLDGAERIVISPDGPLWELPFAALDVGSGDEPRWWGLEKPLSYAPSLTTLVESRRRAAAPASERTVLVLGDPVLRLGEVAEKDAGEPTGATIDGTGAAESAAASAAAPSEVAARSERTLLFPGDEPPPPLPGARVEAVRLGALYGVEPLLGDAATEAAVRERLPGAAIVHFATHGLFHPTQPMSSGVLLAPTAGAEATATDGALQAWEFLAEIELQADLVVLSACETGLGRAVRGEGLVGLTRSLQAAGAQSVVATHWKVEDRAAADLMVSFHEKLRAGLAKDAALHAAMREVAARPETSHPYFWAAYFLSGEAD